MLGICNLVTSEGSWEHNLRLDQLEGTRELPFSSGRGRSHATEGSDLFVFDVALEAEFLPFFFCVDPPGIRVCARTATIVDDCPHVRIGVRINNSQRGGASVFVECGYQSISFPGKRHGRLAPSVLEACDRQVHGLRSQ